MKVDYSKYPEIPPGCQMNHNQKTKVYQVFREGKARSPWCSTRRESIGYIHADGKFVFSKTYLLQLKLHHIDVETRQKETKAQIVSDAVTEAISATELDCRDAAFTSVPLPAIALAAIMMALTGESDCVSISDFLTRNKAFFSQYVAQCDFEKVSHDTVRKALMLIEPEKFESFYLKLLEPVMRETFGRVIAVDGQAVRATGKSTEDKPTVHGASMIMNVYDTDNRVCIAQRKIESKTNEITVGPHLLEGLDVHGCIVTADAMSCQVNFVKTVMKQADYCISLKGNQERSWKEASYLFKTAQGHVLSYESDYELDHGRIEKRIVSMLPGRLLSKELREKWPGLSGGSLIHVSSEITKKSTKLTSTENRYYITSMPTLEGVPEKMAKVIRAHWGVENNLHWTLDNLFRQDRMQADNPNYIENRSALNKLALALLENYRFYLWDNGLENKKLSLHLLQERCRDPKIAIECIGSALGLFN